MADPSIPNFDIPEIPVNYLTRETHQRAARTSSRCRVLLGLVSKPLLSPRFRSSGDAFSAEGPLERHFRDRTERPGLSWGHPTS